MRKADLERLAEMRIREAAILLAAGEWNGAYYLSGYAVECSLKACIVKRLMASDEFPERRFSERCYSHRLADLLDLAGLAAGVRLPRTRGENWDEVEKWKETSRYEHGKTEGDARKLFEAITDPTHGILPWTKSHW